MKKINIYWGSDKDFESAIENLENVKFLIDVLDYINKQEMVIPGVTPSLIPLEVENLVIHTDDYGGVREWALLGFSNNVINNAKVKIETLWLCNPPLKIYKDIKKNFSSDLIFENKTEYPNVEIDSIKKMADEYDSVVIGQSNVIKKILASIYAMRNEKRSRPVTLLFLGDSGIGKTETAKFISSCLGNEMVRVQFSMQQTNNAYQYIFGSDHGEDSLARELIRRTSNVILLDEFDKVSPSFYNAFYQMFDEGKFVDSNYSVDVSKCIIICTTNYKTEKEAEKNLGTPIYSRFSKVVIFKPISIEDKLKIAEKCYGSLFEQLDLEDKVLVKGNAVLSFFKTCIIKGNYPNMRMLKNDMEDALNFEVLKARGIIKY